METDTNFSVAERENIAKALVCKTIRLWQKDEPQKSVEFLHIWKAELSDDDILLDYTSFPVQGLQYWYISIAKAKEILDGKVAQDGFLRYEISK